MGLGRCLSLFRCRGVRRLVRRLVRLDEILVLLLGVDDLRVVLSLIFVISLEIGILRVPIITRIIINTEQVTSIISVTEFALLIWVRRIAL